MNKEDLKKGTEYDLLDTPIAKIEPYLKIGSDLEEVNEVLHEIIKQGIQQTEDKIIKIIQNRLDLTKEGWLKLSKEHTKMYPAPKGFVDKREHICGERLSAIEGERMGLQFILDDLGVEHE